MEDAAYLIWGTAIRWDSGSWGRLKEVGRLSASTVEVFVTWKREDRKQDTKLKQQSTGNGGGHGPYSIFST
jgi:hypothetical protein